jgi:hypothetical protein
MNIFKTIILACKDRKNENPAFYRKQNRVPNAHGQFWPPRPRIVISQVTTTLVEIRKIMKIL